MSAPILAAFGATVVVHGRPDSFERVAGRDAVITALAQLPQRQREVLVLRFYGDLTVAETADAMGASAGTVKS